VEGDITLTAISYIIISGELISRASKNQCEILGTELNNNTSVYWKKVDMQSRVKKGFYRKLDLQFRKILLSNTP
jgi:hypothetical protein